MTTTAAALVARDDDRTRGPSTGTDTASGRSDAGEPDGSAAEPHDGAAPKAAAEPPQDDPGVSPQWASWPSPETEIGPGLYAGMGPEHVSRQARLYGALARAHKKFKEYDADQVVDFPTKSGGEVTFDFAPLHAVVEAVDDALADEGCAMVFLAEEGTLKGWLVHEEGGAIPTVVKVKQNGAPEDFAAEVSKYRRYLTQAMLNVAPRAQPKAPAGIDANRPKAGTAQPRVARAAAPRAAAPRGAGATAARPRVAPTARARPAAPAEDWQTADSPRARRIRELLQKVPPADRGRLQTEAGDDAEGLLKALETATAARRRARERRRRERRQKRPGAESTPATAS